MTVPTILAPHLSTRKPSPLLRTKDAADFLDVSVPTLNRWRMLQTGPRFRKLNGFAVRYFLSDLEAFASEGMKSPQPQ